MITKCTEEQRQRILVEVELVNNILAALKKYNMSRSNIHIWLHKARK